MVVLASASDKVSPAGFWMHYNLAILTYLLTWIHGENVAETDHRDDCWCDMLQ